MGNFRKINADTIKRSFLASTRQYLVGNLSKPQALPNFVSEKVEIGLTIYDEFSIEQPHYHSEATEYQYMIAGCTQYFDVESGESHEFITGDFYMIEPQTIYAQRAKPGTKILFVKIPAVNDKKIVESNKLNAWLSEKIHTIRKDYYYDSCAPEPNSIRPAAAVAIFDKSRVLMLKREDSGKWTLPGGTQEFGESLTGCALREVEEETGLKVEIIDIVGTYTDPNIRIAYSDGEVRQEFTIVYFGKLVSGTIRIDNESTAYNWVPLEALDTLDMADSQRRRVADVINFYKTSTKHLI